MLNQIDLRKGRWQDVLADVEQVDAVIMDPPYSKRTHSAKKAAPIARGDGFACGGYKNPFVDDAYDCIDETQVAEIVGSWHPRCRGWICVMSDHVLIPAWERELKKAGRYVFSPLAIMLPATGFRQVGDGPAQWARWMIVARPRTKEFVRWGSLRGGYIGLSKELNPLAGSKPLHIMRQIVCDYSRPGDLVCDPFTGSGSTLIAAVMERRRAVGSEMDPKQWKTTMRRIGKVKPRPSAKGLFT